MSMGWNFFLYEQVIIGLVAVLYYDGIIILMYNEFGDSIIMLIDLLWYVSVSILGWCVDFRFGDF